jgi:hypothetical protein
MIGLNAQVAINNTGEGPVQSAILDVKSSDKGLLVPRMEINDVDSDQSPVESPVEGLLIYNTGTTDGIPKGFYYWSNSKWNGVTTGNSAFTVNQLLQMYEAAELYEDNSFGSPTTITMTNAGTYYGWVEATEGETFGNTSTDVTDATADKIIIGEDGLYKIEFCISFSGSNNSQVEGAIFNTPFLTGTPERSRIRFLRKLSSAGDIGSGSAHGLIRLYAGDKIDMRFKSNSWSETLDVYNVNFIANKVGD